MVKKDRPPDFPVIPFSPSLTPDDCRFMAAPLTRREMLTRCANGFGALALGALAAEAQESRGTNFAPRARNVIFLYMDGAPSQLDTFDYKPMLEKHHGEDTD